MRVYMWEMKIQKSRLKVRINTQTDPLKIQGRRMKCYSKFECGMMGRSRAFLFRNCLSLVGSSIW